MKTKRKLRGVTTFEFFSGLTFEECLFRFQNDASHLIVDIEQQTDDRARFLITLKGETSRITNITGILYRWGDSDTRIQGMIFSRPHITCVLLLMSLLILLILLMFLILIASTHIINAGTQLVVGVLVLAVVGSVFYRFAYTYYYQRKLVDHLKELLTDRRKKMKAEK